MKKFLLVAVALLLLSTFSMNLLADEIYDPVQMQVCMQALGYSQIQCQYWVNAIATGGADVVPVDVYLRLVYPFETLIPPVIVEACLEHESGPTIYMCGMWAHNFIHNQGIIPYEIEQIFINTMPSCLNQCMENNTEVPWDERYWFCSQMCSGDPGGFY